jgi:molybdopterin converting factor small subunit
MVKVCFRLTEAGEVKVDIDGPKTLDWVLNESAAKAGLELGGVIAIRNGKVIQTETLIDDGDTIDVFPALSGG